MDSVSQHFYWSCSQIKSIGWSKEKYGKCEAKGKAIVLNHLPDTAKLKHDDVIKWKHSPRYWPFVRGIHRSTVNSPHKGQWRGALMFCLIRAWINSWVSNCEAGDLRRYLAHCDVTVMRTTSVHIKSLWCSNHSWLWHGIYSIMTLMICGNWH